MLNKNLLVAIESGEASQRSWCPFQSVMTPPEPSITGINARKSYGCKTQKFAQGRCSDNEKITTHMVLIIWVSLNGSQNS